MKPPLFRSKHSSPVSVIPHQVAGLPHATTTGAGGVPRPLSRRLHRKTAASYIGTSLSWLDKSRLRGDGPVFLQIGGRIVYDTADLDDYLAKCRRQSTSEQR